MEKGSDKRPHVRHYKVDLKSELSLLPGFRREKHGGSFLFISPQHVKKRPTQFVFDCT